MGWILGISAYYHDSAAALIDDDGKIIAAVQQERFSRIKHDPAFPVDSIEYCLKFADIRLEQIDLIVFYDKPLLKFERLLETYLAFIPRGLTSFLKAMPIWLKEKLYLKVLLRRELSRLSGLSRQQLPPLIFTEHHQSHAAAAFFASPFQRAVVLCVDGVGEWATTSAWLGCDNQLTPLWEQHFPHSLGLLYSAFTQYLGFRVNSGEYKVMGLAPYGQPLYVDLIYQHLVSVESDGSFRLNMVYFDFATGLTMTNSRFHRLFGKQPRLPETRIDSFHRDIACSIQAVTEAIMLKLCRNLKQDCSESHLCMAGGVAQNSSANGKIVEAGIFDQVWVQPAANDAGSAVGAALCGYHSYRNRPRNVQSDNVFRTAFLGPDFDQQQIEEQLNRCGAVYTRLQHADLIQQVSWHIYNGAVVGWFEGRMEFGARALGHRSILANPCIAEMKQTLNHKIKRREDFRPFAPIVCEQQANEYFDINRPSPYMQFVVPVREQYTKQLPSITHIDGTARVQTVNAAQHPRMHELLSRFAEHSGFPILINTSFNRRAEPIVCSPEQAYACFMDTEMDYLVLGNALLEKQLQPLTGDKAQWQVTSTPD